MKILRTGYTLLRQHDLTVALADCLNRNRADRTIRAICADSWGFQCHPRCDLLALLPIQMETRRDTTVHADKDRHVLTVRDI